MKVQTKITLLLLLVVATFMAGLWAFRIYDRQKFARIAEEREKERKQSFDAFLEKNGEPLKTLCDYDAYWDQTVRAIANNDQSGLTITLTSDPRRLSTNAVWVYPTARAKKRLSRQEFRRWKDIPELPIPREAFDKLFAPEPYAHFFVKVDNDIMEIRGATVHGSHDSRPRTRRGAVISSSAVSGTNPSSRKWRCFPTTRFRLAPVNATAAEHRADEQNGVVAFSKMLPGLGRQAAGPTRCSQ